MAFEKFFEAVAPKYASPVQKGRVEITEHEPGAKVKKVTWVGSDFDHFDHTLAKDLKQFFESAGSPDVFMHDCDGVILFEEEGKKYMFLTELKSTFSTQRLHEAKTQIASSFLKTNMLLHLSLCYKLEDYIVKGFIVGRPPKSDFKVNLHKGSMLSDKQKEREYELAKRLLILNPTKSSTFRPYELYCLRELPLGDRGIFPEIELHFIEVREPESEITLDIRNYI